MIHLILAACSSAALTLVLKWFRDPKGSRWGILLGNYLTCVLIAFLQMPDKGRLFAVSPRTLLMSCVGGFFFVAGLVCMQSSVRMNGATLTAAFSKLGMLIPLLVSFLFFKEVPTLLQGAGILLAVGAIIVIDLAEKDADAKAGQGGAVLWILLLTLLACGCSESMSKIFERLGEPAEATRFFFFLFLTAALLTAALAAAEKGRGGQSIRLKELTAGILAGVPNYFSSWFLLQSLQRLPAMLVYPAQSVGTILLVTAAGALLFGEKLTRREWAGFALILAALVLLDL